MNKIMPANSRKLIERGMAPAILWNVEDMSMHTCYNPPSSLYEPQITTVSLLYAQHGRFVLLMTDASSIVPGSSIHNTWSGATYEDIGLLPRDPYLTSFALITLGTEAVLHQKCEVRIFFDLKPRVKTVLLGEYIGSPYLRKIVPLYLLVITTRSTTHSHGPDGF